MKGFRGQRDKWPSVTPRKNDRVALPSVILAGYFFLSMTTRAEEVTRTPVKARTGRKMKRREKKKRRKDTVGQMFRNPVHEMRPCTISRGRLRGLPEKPFAVYS
ncbi:hypothetical protein CDAR_583341 [Caerostris darwini]|uniref:Uncharacterized protein n=1 Tax=Caerostris darwini TaxID=1538125 RepID=A0AAV4VB19_9ARAC|nr:hypothetical protein CDAR_583341 [Caerostris darwini]